ncbi:MAG: AbrB family transcriptional regulator [Pseudomonadota bacterium]
MHIWRYITPILVGLIGVVVFFALNLPLPFLLGPISACLLAALFGLKMQGIKILNDGMRSILGVAIGASLTPAVLYGMLAYWPTLSLMMVQTTLIGGIGLFYFYRVCGYGFQTSYYSAMPGGLPDMVAFGEEAGGNVRTISLLHATRVTLIVVGLPFLLKTVWDVDLSNPPGPPIQSVPQHELALMAFSAIFGWLAAKRIGMFGATILGPMIVAGFFAVIDMIHSRPPAEVVWAAQFFIGMMVGVKYTGITWEEVKRDIAAGTGFALAIYAITALVLTVIVMNDLAPTMDALMAFTPGGQAELLVLSIIVGADLPFVIAHHVLRLSTVVVMAPSIARWLGVAEKGEANPKMPLD